VSSPADGSGCGSRPSKNNRQGHEGGGGPDALGPSDLPGNTALRPLSVEPGRALRDECVLEQSDGAQSRPWYAVLNEWREWYDDYRSMHIEYERAGETVRSRLENSYQPRYGKRYYAKLKDLERGVSRSWDSLTTAMLTFTASTENASGSPRCPADHMRDVAEGWRTARKQLHQVLSGERWEYARVWEPHESGYGHLHVAVFVDDADDLDADTFRPVLDSHLRECESAGREAHTTENAVSLNDDVENLGSYISEYIGIFGDSPTERPVSEQMFYAVTWATGTRRVDFSRGAQELISKEQFRRETGLRPEDRGAGDGSQSGAEGREDGAEGEGWEVDSICTVRAGSPDYADPTTGGADMTAIAGRPGMDPPRRLPGPGGGL
jgi:hypothetical protein